MSATIAVNGVTGRSSNNNKYPFTTTQWQELEHQALIYKYMAAGIPIPHDLLYSIKRSFDSSLSSKLFPYQSTPLGWNPYQMGYGKKIDPEPGRCRRTDGKKWRCSKEAYPDSKYCERHMHRGKNRSRKPVESPLSNTNTNTNSSNISTVSASTTTTTNSTTSLINASNLTNQTLLSKPASSSLYSYPSSEPFYNSSNANNLLYPQSSAYSQKDYRERYYQGMKEGVGEHAFFTESSGSSMRGFSGSSIDENWQIGEKQSGNYPNYLQPLQATTATNTINDNHYNGSTTTRQQEEQQDKQCYIWGRDFNCELSMKVDEERSNINEKTTHHFFDEWPIKNNGVRGGLGDDSSSTTQLSISIPNSSSNHHDFFLSNSTNT